MAVEEFPIPYKLNLAIFTVVLCTLVSLFAFAGWVTTWPGLLLTALMYGITMNTAYSLMHEAEHGMLHPNKKLNTLGGVTMALFFPAAFHLMRQGHLGHHMRNRSDDEAFDFYFEGESLIWRYMQLYGVLTGLFWVTIFISNFIAVFTPSVLLAKRCFDRPTEAFLQSFNEKYLPLIRIEAAIAITLHVSLIYIFNVPLLHYAVMILGFGVMWSAMQYVHHWGTERDVVNGARNLTTFSIIDRIWLNHNLHLNHHQHPVVPWLYLPKLTKDPSEIKGSVVGAYLRMWRGPRYTTEHVENRYRGKIIR